MKQHYIHYTLWEDFKNGMWKVAKYDEKRFLKKAIEFTSNDNLYGAAMLRVIIEWPLTCLHNLSNLGINRKAFVGHAACSLEFNCPEVITRMAWGFLTDEQRLKANNKADEAISQWEINNAEILKDAEIITE